MRLAEVPVLCRDSSGQLTAPHFEELAERRGHLAFFYFKYHCDLKHIENYRGWSKR
jgi:hypothetical protein